MAERWLDHMRLDAIQRDPRNVKLHATRDIERSISEHGFGESVLIDERTGRLLAGHGRLDAAWNLHQAGRPAPRDVEVDEDGMWKIPVDRGYSTRDDEHAAAYLLASNQLTIKGGYDERNLLDQLRKFDETMLPLTGFDENDLKMLVDRYETPPVFDDERPPPRRDSGPQLVTCPACGDEFTP